MIATNKPVKLPPTKYLHTRLTYDPETGALKWKRRPRKHFPDTNAWKIWNSNYAGTIAGTITFKGYVTITIDSRTRKVHRVIWKLMTGKEPPETIDHKDGNKSNNIWSNLRAATMRQQSWNNGLRKTNTSGYRGVSRGMKGWRVQINNMHGVRKRFGVFDTPQQAHAAYQTLARTWHGEFHYDNGEAKL